MAEPAVGLAGSSKTWLCAGSATPALAATYDACPVIGSLRLLPTWRGGPSNRHLSAGVEPRPPERSVRAARGTRAAGCR